MMNITIAFISVYYFLNFYDVVHLSIKVKIKIISLLYYVLMCNSCDNYTLICNTCNLNS